MTGNNKFDNYLLSTNLEDKYSNNIIKVYSILSKHNDFLKLKAECQFKICFDTCLIAIQTSRHDLLRLSKKSENEYPLEYSIYSKITKS